VNPNAVPSVTVDELPAKLAGDAILLDVREQDEWDAGHAPAAVHIPMGDIPARLDELPADATVYVVCRSGGRSARVTAYLNGNGWDAFNVEGGMKSWHAGGNQLIGELRDVEAQVI
jgi:rhodanese-related sulfurtransferase